MSKFTAADRHAAALAAWNAQKKRAYDTGNSRYIGPIARRRFMLALPTAVKPAALFNAAKDLSAALDAAEAEQVTP